MLSLKLISTYEAWLALSKFFHYRCFIEFLSYRTLPGEQPGVICPSDEVSTSVVSLVIPSGSTLREWCAKRKYIKWRSNRNFKFFRPRFSLWEPRIRLSCLSELDLSSSHYYVDVSPDVKSLVFPYLAINPAILNPLLHNVLQVPQFLYFLVKSFLWEQKRQTSFSWILLLESLSVLWKIMHVSFT